MFTLRQLRDTFYAFTNQSAFRQQLTEQMSKADQLLETTQQLDTMCKQIDQIHTEYFIANKQKITAVEQKKDNEVFEITTEINGTKNRMMRFEKDVADMKSLVNSIWQKCQDTEANVNHNSVRIRQATDELQVRLAEAEREVKAAAKSSESVVADQVKAMQQINIEQR